MPSIITSSDVARVLQTNESNLPAGANTYIDVAESWAKNYLRRPDLGSGSTIVSSSYDVRDDGFIRTQGDATKVEAREAAGGELRELSDFEWTFEQDGVRMRPAHRFGLVPHDPRYGPERLPRIYVEVRVTQDVSDSVDVMVKEGIALAAAALMIREPVAAKGISGETIGGYSYRLQNGDSDAARHPFFDTAKSLLRQHRNAGAFVP